MEMVLSYRNTCVSLFKNINNPKEKTQQNFSNEEAGFIYILYTGCSVHLKIVFCNLSALTMAKTVHFLRIGLHDSNELQNKLKTIH